MKSLHTHYFNAIDSLLIFLGGLFLFTVGLRQQEIVSFDSRFYLFALEMWRYGLSWFPTTYQNPYPDYPGTSTVLIYSVAKIGHGLTKLTAVLPSAIASALTLVMTYLLGALHSRRWGWHAVIFLLLTALFLVEARAISLDQYITLITVCCFYIVYSATLFKSARRIGLIFPLLVVGFAFRGPIGFVIPIGVVCAFYCIEKDFKKFFMVGFVSLFLLVICIVLLACVAHHVGGSDFASQVLHMEVSGRIKDAHSPVYYYYLIDGLGDYAITFPLMLIMLPGTLATLYKKKLTQQTRFLLNLLGWIFVILLGMSLVSDKKVRYVLAISPALALFCSYLVVHEQHEKYLAIVRKGFYYFCCFFPVVLVGVICFFHQQLSTIYFSYPVWVGLFAALQIIIFVFSICARANITIVFSLAALSFVLFYIGVVEPTKVSLNSARDVVLTIEQMRAKEHAKLVFYREGADGLAIKYLVNMPQLETPMFVQTTKEVDAVNQPAIFVTSREYFKELSKNTGKKFQQIFTGKIGRDWVVVFRK